MKKIAADHGSGSRNPRGLREKDDLSNTQAQLYDLLPCCLAAYKTSLRKETSVHVKTFCVLKNIGA